MATLSVYFEQRRVGTIDIDKNGPGFTYDPGWVGLKGAFPISITMPLRSERIASDTFLPWAANLLPENVQLRTLGQLLGMARGDVIGLLSAIGGDTAGALSIGQPGRTASVSGMSSIRIPRSGKRSRNCCSAQRSSRLSPKRAIEGPLVAYLSNSVARRRAS